MREIYEPRSKQWGFLVRSPKVPAGFATCKGQKGVNPRPMHEMPLVFELRLPHAATTTCAFVTGRGFKPKETV